MDRRTRLAHTEFQLRNNLLAGPLTVTPVLRLANGQEYSLALVTIAPSDVATVDVSQELSNIASPLLEQAGTYGSVVFRFTSPFARNLYAAVMIHEVGQPIGYHVDAFPIDPEYTAGAREGIWWLPRPTVKDSLIIANGSDQPNHCRLYLYNAAGKAGQQDLPIGARQTLRLVVADLIKQAGLTGSYGGLRLEVAQRAGSIDTVYFLYDESNGFSALMKMFDHNPATKLEDRLFAGSQVWKTWAPMLPLQNPDPALALPSGTQLQPKIFLRNTTAKPQVATVKMTYRNNLNRGMLELQPIQLQPYETRLVDVLALQQNKQIPTDAHWALVEISSLGNPDDIMAIASSFDSTGRYGSQTPFADQLSDHWVAGKFEVDATHNSLISVTNAGKKPTDAVLTFHYNHGQGQYQVRRTIAAGDQLWLNLGDIIPGSIPDTKGRTFPPDLTSGTYEIREPGRNNDPSLFEGKIIVDKTYGHLAYGCTTCCGDGYPGIIADPENLPFQAQDSLSVIATNSCTGFDDDLTAQFTGWDTSNHSVATMSSRQIIGVGAGSTNAFSSGTFNYNNGVSKYCTLKNYTPHNTTNVQIPDHIAVASDSFAYQDCGSGLSTEVRDLTYKVYDTSGVQMKSQFMLRENVPTTVSSCNGSTVAAAYTCISTQHYEPFPGEFTDELSAGCPTSINLVPRGYTFANQQWQWCPSQGLPQSIGTIGKDVVQNTLINMDGYTTPFPVGTTFPK